MLTAALQVALAPVLIALSSLAAQRWGERSGGVVSAFPAIAGPFLLLVAYRHGAAFAASAANGTLAGLLALSGFVVAYVRTARRHGWRTSLTVGWLVAAALTGLVGLLAPGPPLGLLIAAGSLVAAHRLTPRAAPPDHPTTGRRAVLISMALAATLVLTLALAAGALGSQLGGALAGLPVIAAVLAVGAHRENGAESSSAVLDGMLHGMAGFVVFCEIVAASAVPLGVAPAFALATAAALALQSALIRAGRQRRAGREGKLQRRRVARRLAPDGVSWSK
jgi:hypothetical protein